MELDSMSKFELYPFQPGERLNLRKPHPCGSREWTVLRAGSDIQLRCSGCGHIQRMQRRSLEKAVRSIKRQDIEEQLPENEEATD